VTSFSELQLEEDIAEESKKRQIISGWNVSRTIAPYMGLLVTNRSITCGSSLITRNILLTAAHCVYLYVESAANLILNLKYVILFSVLLALKFSLVG